MNLNSPLFDRVRIRSEEAEAKARAEKQCQHPGCVLPGEHKAPMGRNREGQYIFMCLPNVQAYNKSYNYFQGMSDDAIADFQKDALTGHRPTWTIGVKAKGNGSAADGSKPHDPLGMFGEDAAKKPTPEEEARARYGKLALRALEILHLDETATPELIRAKYKSWVKQLHPDANNGDRSREEKLREILRAYNTLKTSGHV
ncbi:MAG: J domain-containing protein [Beijerinckiaceae bacterium]